MKDYDIDNEAQLLDIGEIKYLRDFVIGMSKKLDEFNSTIEPDDERLDCSHNSSLTVVLHFIHVIIDKLVNHLDSLIELLE